MTTDLDRAARVAWAKFSTTITVGSDNGPMGDSTRTVEVMTVENFAKAVKELTHDVVAQLRASDDTHQCRKCLWPYTPLAGQSEDCPRCGYDGVAP